MSKFVSGKVSRCTAYHLDENCRLLKKNVKPATDSQIQWHELTPCELCAGDGITTHSEQTWDYQSVLRE